MKLMTITMCLLLVAGCATVGPTTVEQVCAGWRPIKGIATDADVISDKLALSIDAHNRYGAKVDCW